MLITGIVYHTFAFWHFLGPEACVGLSGKLCLVISQFSSLRYPIPCMISRRRLYNRPDVLFGVNVVIRPRTNGFILGAVCGS